MNILKIGLIGVGAYVAYNYMQKRKANQLASSELLKSPTVSPALVAAELEENGEEGMAIEEMQNAGGRLAKRITRRGGGISAKANFVNCMCNGQGYRIAGDNCNDFNAQCDNKLSQRYANAGGGSGSGNCNSYHFPAGTSCQSQCEGAGGTYDADGNSGTGTCGNFSGSIGTPIRLRRKEYSRADGWDSDTISFGL